VYSIVNEHLLSTTTEAQKALDYIALLYMLEGNLKAKGLAMNRSEKKGDKKPIRYYNKWKAGCIMGLPLIVHLERPFAMLLACGLVSAAIVKKDIFT
jgi:hypothetical protein